MAYSTSASAAVVAPEKCDIHGVLYEKKYLQGMDQITARMAGALKLDGSAKLWDLYLRDPATKPILDGWLETRKNSFGTKLKHAHMTLRPAIVNLAFILEIQPLICSPKQPTIGSDGINEKTLAPLTCLWFCVKLIKAKPVLFPRSKLNAKPINLDTYDVTHAYKLLSWIYRMQKGHKVPISKPKNLPVEAPVYVRDPETDNNDGASYPSRSVEELLGLTSKDSIQAMENAQTEANGFAEGDSGRAVRFRVDIIADITNGIHQGLNTISQCSTSRSPCNPNDRANLLWHLMEIDHFQDNCILHEGTHESLAEDVSSNDAAHGADVAGMMTKESTAILTVDEATDSVHQYVTQADDIALFDKENPTSTMDEPSVSVDLIPISHPIAAINRTPGLDDILDMPTTVRQDIPPCSIVTVELMNPERVQPLHDQRYTSLVSGFRPKGPRSKSKLYQYTAADPSDGSNSHRRALRGLSILAFSTKLDRFCLRISARHDLIDRVQHYAGKEDRGFGIFYANTTLDLTVPAPSDPLLQACYLAMDAPKLRYLLKILHDEGAFNTTAAKPPRFIVIANWPLVLWVTEMFLNSLSIPFVSMRPNMPAEDRKKAISYFTSTKYRCQILLTNYTCGTKGLNLDRECSRIVILEPPLNNKILFQAIGSVHRAGQKSRQKVWILFQDRTFNRWLEANNTIQSLPRSDGKLKGTRQAGFQMSEMELSQVLGRSRCKGRLSRAIRFIFGPYADRRAHLRLWNLRHEVLPAVRHRAQARIYRAILQRQTRLANRSEGGKPRFTDLLVGRRQSRRRQALSTVVGGLLVPFEKAAHAARKASQGGAAGEGPMSGYGPSASSAWGSGRGTRRKKVFEYIRAANELRQSYTASWTAQWNASRELNEEYLNNAPGAFPDVEIVRGDGEEMVIFPSYARLLGKNQMAEAQRRRRESTDTLDEYRGVSDGQEQEFSEFETFDDENAVVAVDVRGCVYAPYRGPMTRKQRLAIAIARKLTGVPAPTNTLSDLDENCQDERIPKMTEKREEEIVDTEAQTIIKQVDRENESGWKAAAEALDEDTAGRGPQRMPTTASVQSTQSAQSTQSMQMSNDELSVANAHLMERIRPFLSNPKTGIAVTVFFFNEKESQSRNVMTNESGHFSIRAALSFVPTHVRVLASEELSAMKEVKVIETTGVSLISDIDDTVKHSAVANGAKEIFRNVFVRELAELTIEGVADWYNSLAKLGVEMHYVSNAPWQIYPLLNRYFRMVGLPPGSFHLKQYSGMLQGIFEPTAERKKASLEQILQDFPERKFILVGDSGEADLEVYTEFVMTNPGRIIGVFIRDVTTPEKTKFFQKSVDHLENTPSRSRSTPELDAHIDSAASRPSLPPRPPRMASDPVRGPNVESEDLIDLSDEPPRRQSDPEQPLKARTPPTIPSKPSSLRSVTNTADLADKLPESGVPIKRKPAPPLPRRHLAAESGSSYPGEYASGRPTPGDRGDAKQSESPKASRQAPPPPPPRRSNTGSIQPPLDKPNTNLNRLTPERQPTLPSTSSTTSRSSSPSDHSTRSPAPPTTLRSPASNVSLSQTSTTSSPETYPPSRASSINSSAPPAAPLPNKREELWRRRWERASEIMADRGVVLGSWRVGKDVQDVSLWLVKEAQKESRGENSPFFTSSGRE
ncbi:hypothetical protein BJX61DRAFT_532170 [Aspergillus egyptiacus]|nr:hypothetical protein BJX61DRAFT_532170 [Aspergillus egyptiacus]